MELLLICSSDTYYDHNAFLGNYKKNKIDASDEFLEFSFFKRLEIARQCPIDVYQNHLLRTPIYGVVNMYKYKQKHVDFRSLSCHVYYTYEILKCTTYENNYFFSQKRSPILLKFYILQQ